MAFILLLVASINVCTNKEFNRDAYYNRTELYRRKIMPSVSIKYNFSQFNLRVDNCTLINDILVRAIEHFKLGELDYKWKLLHGKRELALFLPYNQHNLPPGTSLTLVASNTITGREGGKIVSIKFRAMGLGSHIAKIAVGANVRKTVEEVCSIQGWDMEPSSDFKFSLFSKTLTLEELQDLAFQDLGVTEDVMIQLRIPLPSKRVLESKKPSHLVSNVEVESTIKSANSNSCTIEKKDEKVHKVRQQDEDAYPRTEESAISTSEELYTSTPPVVIASSSTNRVIEQNSTESSDADYELTEADVMRYQSMLSKRAMSGPLMTKRLREKQEERKNKKIEDCKVRIKFPDLALLDICLKSAATMEDVYRVVTENLHDSSMEFTLYQSYPHQRLERSQKNLVQDLKFAGTTLLLLNTDKKGPFLKQSVLDSAKKPSITESAQKDVEPPYLQIKPNKINPVKKIPKWMKLSKK